jgi:hypothetical protein
MLLFLAVSVLHAQQNKVTLNGVATDASGATVASATVTATNTATRIAAMAQTDSAGRYTITNLDPGTYDVQISAPGFATVVHKAQVFLVGQTVTINFAVQVGAVSQVVEVAATAPQTISTTDSTVAIVLEPEQVDNLPTIQRTFETLAEMSPGVQVGGGSSATGSTSVLIGGSQNYQTGIILDGSSVQNQFYGGSYINYAQDWIQEFSLVSDQPTAEYGDAQGGVVNAITRSGGNDVHGRVYGFFQNAALNSTPKFLPAADAGTNPPYNLERIGGMIGGPIKKDKLFYFGGYEYLHNLVSTPVAINSNFVGVASSSGVFPVTTGDQVAMVKIDWQPNPNNHFSFRGAGQYASSINSGVGTSRTLGNGTTGNTPVYLPSGTWTKVISPTEVNQMDFMFAKSITYSNCNYAALVGPYPNYPSQPGSLPGGDPVGWWADLSYPTASGGAVVTGCPTGFAYPGKPNIGYANTALDETFSLIHGAHSLKFGVSLSAENLKWYYIRNTADGAFTINGSTPFDPSNSSTFPVSDTMVGFSGGNGQHYDGWAPHGSLFAQDSFKVASSLTLNMGIRYDLDLANWEFTQRYINKNIATDKIDPLNAVSTDYSNVQPRIGFAWTPFHDGGKTVVRGGVGLFFDESHEEQLAIVFGQGIDSVDPTVVSATVAGSNPWCESGGCSSGVPAIYQSYVKEVLGYTLATYTLPNFALGTYTFGGNTYTIPAPTVAGPGGTVIPASTAGGVIVDNPSLRIPGETQFSGGIGRQFGHGLTAQGDYVYNRGFRQILFLNQNISTAGTVINPQYESVVQVENNGIFNNNSLRAQLTYRDTRADLVQLAYTLAWARDDSTQGFATLSSSGWQTNPFNPRVDYGPANEDPRHTIVLSGVAQGKWGLQLAPIFSFTSALPYTATTTAAVPSCPSYDSVCYPVGYTRNSLRGSPQISLNARVSENIKLHENQSVMVFLEGYNVPNVTNFTSYTTSVLSSSFGKATAAGAMRQLQVGAKFDF